MTIDRVNKINNAYNVPKKNEINKPYTVKTKDSVNISENAKKTSEIAKYIEIVKNAPDIRSDKVKQAKINLQSYMKDSRIDGEVLSSLTEKIMKVIIG